MPDPTTRRNGYRPQRFAMLLGAAVLAAAAGPVQAQLSEGDIDALRRRGRAEGWTFTVGRTSASERPMSELCGTFVPPDWWRGANFDPMDPQFDPPTAWDWRDHNGCTPIRDQTGCGGCWAFSAIGTLESAILLTQGHNTDLSEQWLISCTNAGSCNGGEYGESFDYLTCDGDQDPCGDSGAVLESLFPYQADDVSCGCPYFHSYCLDSWTYVGGTEPTVEQIKQAIFDHGPLSATVYVNSAFAAYTGGVFNACENRTINHAVVLVGWDDSLGTEGAWILRNSWSTDWGENGYMYIEYECSRVGRSAAYVQYSPHGLGTNPFADLLSVGPNGGPFEPDSLEYTLHNYSDAEIEYSVTKTANWLDLSSYGGAIPAGGSVSVTASINSFAASLEDGHYEDVIDFVNETDNTGDTRRYVVLDVGDWCSLVTGKLQASDIGDYDIFGRSCDTTGDLAIIGAPGNDDQGAQSGSAYIYRNNGTAWNEEAKLLSFVRDEQDEFGWSVAIDGNVALVGAYRDSETAEWAGSAYVFRYGGGVWVEEAKLLASDGAKWDNFGYSVDISGDVAIIGTPGDSDDQYTYPGAAYVFRYDLNSGLWEEEAKLVASVPGDLDYLGWSVSIDGDVAIVGAPHSPYSDIATGAAYIFSYSGSSWFEEARLEATAGREGDMFGFSVSIGGDAVIVGAPARNDDETEDLLGTAWIYRNHGASWDEEAHLPASDGRIEDDFGRAVAITGDYAVVGAPGEIYGEEVAGAAYVFHFEDSLWIEHDKLAAVDGVPGDGFGVSLGLSDIAVMAGAPWDEDRGVDSGSVYVFSLADADCNSNGAADICDIYYGTSQDCNSNGVPDECDIADGFSTDEDHNGVPDECDQPDCNENGIPDFLDIEYGISFDCDEDGIPDECGEDCNQNGIADSCDVDPEDPDENGLVSEDCNYDGIPDECLDTIERLELNSGRLSPIGDGSPQYFTLPGLMEVMDDVLLRFTAHADIGSSVEWIDVRIKNQSVGKLYQTTGEDCASPPNEEFLTIAQDDFNALIDPGEDVVIAMIASDDVKANACDGENYITISVDCLGRWDGMFKTMQFASGELSPIGDDSPQSFTIPNAPLALGNVVISFGAYADLDLDTEWIEADINGVQIARLYEEGIEDCADPPAHAQVTVPIDVFNSAIAGGQDAVITMTASEEVSPTGCGGTSFITVSTTYLGLYDVDANDNGIPDECECPADIDDTGIVDIDDLFKVLAAWGVCDGCPEDLNHDGIVDIDDLFAVLAAWGPCP